MNKKRKECINENSESMLFFPVSLLPKSRSHIQGSSVTSLSLSPVVQSCISKVIASPFLANTALHQGATAEPIAFRKGIIHVRMSPQY